MTDRAWQQATALRRVEADQRAENPPPLPHSIAAAARYVGAEVRQVEAWWNFAGSLTDPNWREKAERRAAENLAKNSDPR